MSVIGIDIGGANLKFSDGRETNRTVPFPLWRDPNGLSRTLHDQLKTLPDARQLAVTMTGELCDCFEKKQQGVQSIVDSVETVASGRFGVRYYQVTGKFVAAPEAKANWRLTAAANWHAIAALTAIEFADERGLLVDIGSTTTDLIPFADGIPTPSERDDLGRLLSEELLYCGAGRTPLNFILPEFLLAGTKVGLAAEYFASIEDALIVTGLFPERADTPSPCDGRPLTKPECLRRLARMLCAEPEELANSVLPELAFAAQRRLLRRLVGATSRLLERNSREPTGRLVFSGSGERIARPLLRRLEWTGRVAYWGELFGREASSAAAAFAVARLAGKDAASW
jgi:(4-(4-[2-(gamma-L-glutamylamino)ethyl]phenoxymethyl)furan-2-yl)methanamine synthase